MSGDEWWCVGGLTEDACRSSHVDALAPCGVRYCDPAPSPSIPPEPVTPSLEREGFEQRWTDDDLLAAIGSALEVPTGMGETAFVWEAYKPEGVALVLRQRLKEAGVLAPTSPAVAPEARGGLAEKALRMALDAFDGIAQMHGLENDQPAAASACREALDALAAASGSGEGQP